MSNVLIALLVCGSFMALRAQIVVDTYAGGKILSGVSAQTLPLGYAQIAGMTWDASGTLVFADRTANLIRRIRPDGILETVAGNGTTGFSGDGGPALGAALNWPTSPKYDANGNLYFADYLNFRIRKIDTHGTITTVAGDGVPFAQGMDVEGPALMESVGEVNDLAVDSRGNVYFTEFEGSTVRRVTTDGRLQVFGTVTASASYLAIDTSDNVYVVEGAFTINVGIRRFAPDGSSARFAGYGTPPPAPVAGDGVPALGTFLYQVPGLAVADGKVYLVQVSQPATRTTPIGTRIRVIDSSGLINTIAGGGVGLSSMDGPALPSTIAPTWLAADANGNVAFADSISGGPQPALLREVTAQSTLKTLAGGSPKAAPDGVAAKDAWFLSPTAIAFDRAGNLYVADAGTCLIRKIGSNGLLATAAGSGTCASALPAQPATGPDLPPPASIAIDSQNRIYLLDTGGNSYVITPDGKFTPTKYPPTLGPGKIAVDGKDRVYLLSMFALNRINPDGSVQNIVAMPSQPGVPPPGFGPTGMRGMGVDPSGTVYFNGTYLGSPTDYIFKINDDGTIAQVHGSTSTPLHLLNSYSLAVDGRGTVWIADGGVSFVNASGQGGIGNPSTGYSGDGGPAQQARFNTVGNALAPNGDLYYLDDNRVRRLTSLTPPPTPAISAGGIVNAVSYTGGAIAPGELISIFGSNFGASGLVVPTLENNRVPFVAGRTKVLFDGNAGTIAAVTPNQIKLFAPNFLTAESTTKVTVQVDAALSATVSVPVANTAPGVAGFVVNQDGTINSATNPAPAGTIISAFGTGEGLLTPPLVWGFLNISSPLSSPVAPVTVTIGGQTALVLYAGEAPLQPAGVFQVNARIPAGVSGSVAVVVTIGDASAKAVTVSVR